MEKIKVLMIDDNENILNTYKRFNVVLTKGSGSILVDENGKEYIDFSDEFHRLCEEGRVQSNDKPLERRLFPGNIKITFN